MLPVLPLLALAIAGGALALSKRGSATSGPSVAPTSDVTLAPGTGIFDRNLPLVLEQTTSRMIATDTSPADLQEFANALLPDYPIAAAALDAKAATLGAPPLVPLPPSTVPPQQAPAPSPVAAPPAFLPPTPIFSVPPVAAPPAAPPPDQGTTTVTPPTIVPWPSGLQIPTGLGSIPASYTASSPETASIQTALNAWIAAVGAPLAPLTVDSSFGPMTQQASAAFQAWENAINPAAQLAVDGLPGPDTQTYLLDFGPMTAGAY